MRRTGHSRRQASVDYPRYPPITSALQQIVPVETIVQNAFASDYDSDNQGYISDFPAKPPPVNRTKEELNLSVIQRHNPEITAIHSIAPYATIYDFASTPEPGWQKSGVVGTLFICELTPGKFNEQRYHVIVLNRNGLDNFEAELRQSNEGGVEIMDEYVIITQEEDSESKVNGIYIYSEGEGTSTAAARSANGELMKQLAIVASRSRAAAEAQAVSSTNGQHVEEEPYLQPFPQPSPAPPIAPAPSRPIDLLALFQPTSENEGAAVRNTIHEQATPDLQAPTTFVAQASSVQTSSQGDVLLNLFRGAGLA